MSAALLTMLCIVAPALRAQSAAQVYGQYCSVCHGERGDGQSHVRQGLRPPPRDFTAADGARELTRERMIASVTQGRAGTAMSAWGGQLDAATIAAVVDYIRENFMPATASATSVTSATVSRGASIYAETCSVCHGDNGAGAVWGRESLNPPPADFTNPARRAVLSRERMIASVTQGRPGTAMVAFASQLSAADIEAVVDHIRSHYMLDKATVAAVQAAPGDAALPAHALAPGDVHAGRALYMANCIACHGAQGDGAGPRAYFIFPRPRNFLDPTVQARFDRAALRLAIKQGVAGREMPAWGTVLNDTQIADIAEFVVQEFMGGGAKEKQQ